MHAEIRTSRREQFVDITDEVRSALHASPERRSASALLVFCRHTTAGLTVNENADPDVAADLLVGLSRMAPHDAGWQHAEGNSDAHLKASLVGSSVLVPVRDGELDLGTWQGVYLCEFDGPRTRRISVTMLS